MYRRWVDYGLEVFKRCSYRPLGHDENVAILGPLYHLLEMADGVQILLAQSAPIPARLPLRSAFEALLTIEYITTTDTERRGYAYLVSDIRSRLAFYRSLRPGSTTNLSEKIKSDIDGGFFFEPQIPSDLDARIQRLENLLEQPRWTEANAEFDKLKSKRSENWEPPWFAAYGGPQSRRKLASILARDGQYDLLYSEWFRTTHGENLNRQLTRTASGEPAVTALRDPSEIGIVTTYVVLWSVAAIRRVLLYYRPSEAPQLKQWYASAVQPQLHRFIG